MNSNGDYTICNLDNHTYSTNFPHDTIPTTGYGYSNVNNGLVDTGQLVGGYGATSLNPASAVDLSHTQPPQQQQQHHHHHAHHLQYPGPNSVITHASQQQTGGYGMPPSSLGQTQPYNYYTHNLLPNGAGGGGGGGGATDLSGTPPPYSSYAESPLSTPITNTYRPQSSPQPPQSNDGPPLATYKWMQVKRSIAKPAGKKNNNNNNKLLNLKKAQLPIYLCKC